MFKKFKQNIKKFMTGKSGFSLVELIVVIAIMAVMAAVLAPALLGYVERSRAQKDDSAMGEVTNAIQLSIADSTIYDEVLQASVKDNYSCYADGDVSTNIDTNKTITKSPDLWLFNDNARLLDETVYIPSGKMRGITITFKPNGEAEYILKDGIVNQMGNDSTKKGSLAGKTLEEINFEGLYNRLRSTVGDTIKVSSQTYRNSDYTIFISLGTTGGNQADKQDAIKIYGQYNGTNLSEVAQAGNIASGSQDKGNSADEELTPTPTTPVNPNKIYIEHDDVIPENGYYLSNETGSLLTAGSTFPRTVAGDIYAYEDYYYTYNGTYWSVSLRTSDMHMLTATTDKQQTSYSNMLSMINSELVQNISYCFKDCQNLTTVPSLSAYTAWMNSAFDGCTSLNVESIIIPQYAEGCKNAFSNTNVTKLHLSCYTMEFDYNQDNGPAQFEFYHNASCDLNCHLS